MKPITNILLILALICYVFLPFYDISFQGGLTGFGFTAGTISKHFTLSTTVFALLPFITCFAAIGFNTLKNRWWGLLSIAFILLALWFFQTTSNYHDYSLSHIPEVTPDNDLGEGFPINGLGFGFNTTCVILVIALITQILSLLPYKFNESIERAVDEHIDRGLEDMRAFGTRMSEDVNRWRDEHKTGKQPKQKPANIDSAQTEPQATQSTEQDTADHENHSRFMPPENNER